MADKPVARYPDPPAFSFLYIHLGNHTTAQYRTQLADLLAAEQQHQLYTASVAQAAQAAIKVPLRAVTDAEASTDAVHAPAKPVEASVEIEPSTAEVGAVLPSGSTAPSGEEDKDITAAAAKDLHVPVEKEPPTEQQRAAESGQKDRQPKGDSAQSRASSTAGTEIPPDPLLSRGSEGSSEPPAPPPPPSSLQGDNTKPRLATPKRPALGSRSVDSVLTLPGRRFSTTAAESEHTAGAESRLQQLPAGGGGENEEDDVPEEKTPMTRKASRPINIPSTASSAHQSARAIGHHNNDGEFFGSASTAATATEEGALSQISSMATLLNMSGSTAALANTTGPASIPYLPGPMDGVSSTGFRGM